MKNPAAKNKRNFRGIWLLPEANIRLNELQLELKKKGCKHREVTLSKLVETLILSTRAGELLEEKFLST